MEEPDGAVEEAGGAVEEVCGAVEEVCGAVEVSGGAEELGGAVEEAGAAAEELDGAVEEVSGAVEEVGGAVEEAGGSVEEVGGAAEEIGGAVEEVGGAVEVAVEVAVAAVRIEPGLERKVEAEAELLAELGLTSITDGTVLNDSCKSYYAEKTTIEELGTIEELQSHLCLSEISSERLRTGAVTAKFGCKTGQKLAYGVEKRGHKFLPPNFFTICFPLRISRRF